MEPQFKKTFIPQKPVTSSPKRSRKSVNLFSLISSGVFIGALVASGALFGYEYYLNSSINKLNSELVEIQNDFTPEVIEELVAIDRRLEIANELVKNHVALTPVFDFLSKITLQSLRFDSFIFNNVDGQPVISMTGEALGFNSIALQSDVIEDNNFIVQGLISGLNIDEELGSITFNTEQQLDPDLISYVNKFRSIPEDVSSLVEPEEIIPEIISTSTEQVVSTTTTESTTNQEESI